jgi:DNA-binding transcriptional MocR family regulator
MDWIPTLSEGSGPVYRRIVEALSNDIASGRLKRGQQLPTHRALAQALGIDLTTVTRAYGEARRRGLLDARVGQGTFVSETTTRAAADVAHPVKIDLSMNVPPQPIEANLDARIAHGLASIEKEAGFSAFLNYQLPGGGDEDRDTAANWLRARVPKAKADRLVIYPGSQAAIFNALLSITLPGDVVVTEGLTYPGIKAAAGKLGLRLIGVTMDEQGILPDALGNACKQHKPKATYLVPTMHNPTTATQSPSRRKAVAEIIRKAGAILIEDDAYGSLDPSISPIANLIPERTYLAVSLSKCIVPALRVSFLLTPDVAAKQMLRGNLQATSQMAPPLMLALVMHWIRVGVADQIVAAIRNEAIGRQQLAAKLLKGQPFAAYSKGHHLWLSLPRHWSRGDFVAHVLREGLAVVPSEAFAVDQAAAPHAVRVSLGAARNRTELSTALHLLAVTLKASTVAMQIV